MSNDFSLQCPLCHMDFGSWNITHNLTKMAREAGLYGILWHPKGIDLRYDKSDCGYIEYKSAFDMIPILEEGLKRLLDSPIYFKKFNPDNGWGSYENLVEFVNNILVCCKEHPNAIPFASI